MRRILIRNIFLIYLWSALNDAKRQKRLPILFSARLIVYLCQCFTGGKTYFCCRFFLQGKWTNMRENKDRLSHIHTHQECRNLMLFAAGVVVNVSMSRQLSLHKYRNERK